MNKGVVYFIAAGIAFIALGHRIFPESPYEIKKLKQEIALNSYSEHEVEQMGQALKKMALIQDQLASANSNVVMEVLKNQGDFYGTTHYPSGEVYDPLTECQYYYHAHRDGEHGHFHTFHICDPDSNHYRFAHLISISMDDYGNPKKLFIVTQWHEGEVMLDFEEAKWRICHFKITHNYPSKAVNEWLNAAYKAFQPQMIELMREHIAKVSKLGPKKHQGEVATSMPISLHSQEILLNQYQRESLGPAS